MIGVLERAGARMLDVLLPKLTASAGVCACDPGYCWCQNRETRNYCCCSSDCKSTSCWCSPEGCNNPW